MCICLGAVSCYSPDPLFKAHRRVPRANANASSLFAHTRILSPANHLARLCGIASSPRDVLETNGPVDVIRGARKFLHPLRYAFKGCGRQPSIACPGPGPVRERERERERESDTTRKLGSLLYDRAVLRSRATRAEGRRSRFELISSRVH
jgi:hypothetical protein